MKSNDDDDDDEHVHMRCKSIQIYGYVECCVGCPLLMVSVDDETLNLIMTDPRAYIAIYMYVYIYIYIYKPLVYTDCLSLLACKQIRTWTKQKWKYDGRTEINEKKKLKYGGYGGVV